MNAAIISSRAMGRCASVRQPRQLRAQAVVPMRRLAPFTSAAERASSVRVAFFGGNKDTEKNAYGFAGETRDDFSRDDVNFYFEYMGLLADEKCYDRVENLLETREPIDVILILAAEGNDLPKLEEVLNAGANPHIKSKDGRLPHDIATNESAKRMLAAAMSKVPVPL